MTTLRFSVVTLSAFATLLFSACGDDSRPRDSGSDTSIPLDTGTVGDSSRPDSTTMPDSARPDTGGGGSCGGSACDLVTGGGCGAGQGCQFLAPMMGADPTAMCVPAGTAGDGDACESYMDCQEGFSCIPGAGTEDGTCHHYCCPGTAGADSACPIGQMCSTTFSGTDTGFCASPDVCDPVAMTGCDGTEACYPGPDGTYQCASPGELTEGEACETFVNECGSGLACLMSQCHRLCDMETMMGCGSEQTCSIGLMGFESLGACAPVATP